MSDSDKPGYGQPPKDSQFAKGTSGNPKGRPKGSKNFATTLDKELNARVPITENGTRRTVSKQEAIAKQMVNKSASGDTKFTMMVLSELRRIADKVDNPAAQHVFNSATAESVFQSLLERLRKAESVPDETTESPTPDSNSNNGENT